MLFRTYTLGCKVNQYETEYLREGLAMAGYTEATGDETADLCIINTCTVTARSDSKSRQVIRKAIRANPAARIVVTGCYATRCPDDLLALDGVSKVITDKRELPDFLRSLGVGDPPPGVSGLGGRHRAFIKVQDGCANFCSYCIIPYVRPAPFSREPDEIIAEIGRLITGGYREVVLTGIHLGQFGQEKKRADSEPEPLAWLLEQLVAIEGQFRLRLSSIEAVEVSDTLLDVMAAYPEKICPHLHLPLQSGSDSVLKRMNRRAGVETFLETCQRARAKLDNPAITTDIMVGFPGETDQEFLQTCETARQAGFSKMHLFPFSPREGTPAATMEGQVPETVRQQCLNHLMQLEGPMRLAFFESLVGHPLTVLCEERSKSHPGSLTGTSGRYATVKVACSENMIGHLVQVRADKATEHFITGTLESEL